MTTSAERTIGLGRASAAWGPICADLGIGERRAPNLNLPEEDRPAAGWFVSEEEHQLLLAESERRNAERRRDRAARKRAEYRAAQEETRASHTSRPAIARAIETWRRECADPMSSRSPNEAWTYACRCTLGGDVPLPPLPEEAPQERLPMGVVIAEIAGRRDGGENERSEYESDRVRRLQARRRRASRKRKGER